MKIGIVLPDLPQYSETFFKLKIEGLIRNGHEVVLFVPPGRKAESDHSYRIKRSLPGRKESSVVHSATSALRAALSALGSPLRSKKFISLETSSGRSFSSALRSLLLNSYILSEDLDRLHFGFATTALGKENIAEAVGARMSVSFRGFDINVYPLKYPGCYDLLWKKVGKVHTISDYLRKKAVSLGLNEHVPYEKISPAVRTGIFGFKEDAGVFHTPLRILTVGRLSWVKDYETALSAMKILKEQGIDFTYEFIGEGIELERLKFAAYQCGISDRVNFAGKLSHEKITEKMRSCDIYLQTSMQEGFCVSVLEAQATGLMTVVSDAEGLKENVVDGVTGFVAERRKPAAFAKRILEVVAMDEGERKAIAKTARERVEREFDVKKQDEKFNNFFIN